MEETSNRKGYLWGILLTLAILIIGYLINPVFGVLNLVKISWPTNLYFISLLLGIGIATGLISNSDRAKYVFSWAIILPVVTCLILFGGVILIWPDRVDHQFYQRMLSTPLFLIFVFSFYVTGAFIGLHIKELASVWRQVIFLLVALLFSFSTAVGQYDYYNLSVKIGPDRALFEAQDDVGKSYRIPFAIKLLNINRNTNEIVSELSSAQIRLFETVDDFEDVILNRNDNYRIKGWSINLIDPNSESEVNPELLDLSLVFDRWIELKWISLILLLISFVLLIRR